MFVELTADSELVLGFNLILATMQLAVISFPVGPPFQNTSVLVNEMADESRFICDNVMINTFRHTSIRYLGVVVILAWSIITMSLSFPRAILKFCHTRLGWTWCGDLVEAWKSDSMGLFAPGRE